MQRPDFNSDDEDNSFYDLREDWDLIESSFAKQYGIRIRSQVDMPWAEFCTLLCGLMPDTPLGSIISIRSETDEEVIRNFNKDQRNIRNEFLNKKAERQLENEEKLNQDMLNLAKMFENMFGKGV